MTFNLADWQEQFTQKLSGWKQQMQAAGVKSVYGFVSATALWPVIYAVQSGQMFPALSALGGIIAALGTNLLASELEGWKDSVKSPEDLAAQLEEKAVGNVGFRNELDAVLQKLDGLETALQQLAADDHSWFLEQIKGELQQLGNTSFFEAFLSGSGAIAQGEGAVAAGERGIGVGGDVNRAVLITGNNNKVEITYLSDDDDPTLWREAYLGHVFNDARELQLSGIDPKAALDGNDSLTLDGVYTALLTGNADHRSPFDEVRRSEEKPKPVSALASLNDEQFMVLLGDPGSGKSTFVNFVALCLSGEAISHPVANISTLTKPLPIEDQEAGEKSESQKWNHGALIPVRVELRDFAMKVLSNAETASANDIWKYIAASLESLALQPFAEHLKKELLSKGGLIMLDGLDEVPDAEELRPLIKQAVGDFTKVFSKCRFLITSRTYAYQRQEWEISGFCKAFIQPFNTAQINCFVDSWYHHISSVRKDHKTDFEVKAAVLKHAISGNPNLRELAERPLLLTLMASLHAWRGGNLPDRREELYNDAVDLLLDLWERPKIKRNAKNEIEFAQPSIIEWLQLDRRKARDLLNRLAFEAHSRQRDQQSTADIPESDLVMGLLEISENLDAKPQQLINYLSFRAGLLIPHGVKVYSFPHRTFQEYLAACYLTDEDFPDKVSELARKEPTRWREVLLLAAAKATRGSASAIWSLAETLCYALPDEESKNEDAWGAHLAASAVVENARLDKLSAAQETKRERLQGWLLHLIAKQDFPVIERAKAGRNLAELGDPREEILKLEKMPFCMVPAGPFWMGAVEKGEHALSDEKPLHQFEISYDYWLAQYLVGNAQYLEFVAKGGYLEEEYWSEALLAGLWSPEKLISETHDGQKWIQAFKSENHFDYGKPFNFPNHPVVGISWYEALAYCRWLTAQWREAKLLPLGWEVRLPSEVEWEKAARGGLEVLAMKQVLTIGNLHAVGSSERVKNPLPRRIYPWGEERDQGNMANYNVSGIGSTTALGCFVENAGPYGNQDLSGNIWEWCRSKWRGDYSIKPNNMIDASGSRRILRGGCWGGIDDFVRCSSRGSYNPEFRSNYIGFRVGLFPIKTDK